MKEIQERIAHLPLFGTVEWSQETIPHVADGPKGGISGIAAAVHGGRIYVAGGFIPAGDGTDEPGSRTSRWVHEYDPAAGTWARLTDLPVRREYLRGIVADDVLYLLGGAAQHPAPPEGVGYQPYAHAIQARLDERPLQWTAAGQLTEPLTHMAVGKVGPYLIVAGGNRYDRQVRGYHDSTILGTVNALDLRQPRAGWQVRTPIPGRSRAWCGYAACRERLYVFGGLTFMGNKCAATQEAWAYDPYADRWPEVAQPPLAIGGWSAGVYRERYVLLVGGVVRLLPEQITEDTGPNEQLVWSPLVFVYDAGEDRWMRVPGEIISGRAFGGYVNDTGICVIGDTIYVIGGEGTHGTHTNYLRMGRITPFV